jgi:hypothetical protein
MFTEGFRKKAYDEAKEYEQANKVDNQLSKLEGPTHEKPLKVGARIAYYSDDRGWKEGPWAHHTKGCSRDEVISKDREDWKKEQLKAHKIPDDFHKIKGAGQKAKQEIFRQVGDQSYEKFPMHHRTKNPKGWHKEAIGIGDLGRVMEVEKGGIPRYKITWDKHPDCVWGNYDARNLKKAPEGM